MTTKAPISRPRPVLPYTPSYARTHAHTRTLPLRIAPLDGESLTSWLATIAARLQTPYPVLLNTLVPRAVNASKVPRYNTLDGFAPPELLAAVAAATGVNERQVTQMTVAGLGLPAVVSDVSSRGVSTGWGRPLAFRRYCPPCLEQTNGRWSLQWRLPWVTVCHEHACLLHDTCAVCGLKQYAAPGCFHDRQPPRPQFCRCSADLRQAPVLALPAGADMIEAQRAMNALVASDVISTGIYSGATVTSAQFLADTRRLAMRILGSSNPRSLSSMAGKQDRVQTCRQLTRLWRVESESPGARIPFSAHGRAAIVSVGITAALHVIREPSREHAATALAALAPHDSRAALIYVTRSYRGYQPSAALRAVEILTQAKQWATLERLRFRCYGPMPRRPDPPSSVVPILRSVPTLMWTPWAAALDVFDRTMAWTTYRQTLSWLMLEVGVRLPERALREGLQSTAERKRVSAFADAASLYPRWTRVAEALTALHSYLGDHPAPIDYQRRRELDYSDLLSTEEWKHLWPYAKALHPRPAPIHVARIWMFERLSGMPAGRHTAIRRNRYNVDRFLLRLTPDLKDALDAHAARFLNRHGITDEPVTWSPPLEILGDHPFPTRIDGVNIAELHTLLGSGQSTVPGAARELDIPLPLIRHVLEEHPLPPKTKWPNWLQEFDIAVSDEELRRLYCTDGRTFDEIGLRYGIPAHHVAQRARKCGIPRHRPARAPIPAAWIREHHIKKGQTIGEMAAELGDDPSRVRYWAHKHQIPLHRYYRRAEDPEIRKYVAKFGVGPLLEPLLLDKSGWNRLQRFASVTTHRNIADAAAAIGCHSDTLSRQIAGLEKILSVRLIERTTSRYTPMTITAEGNRLAVAILRIQHHSDRAPRRSSKI
ncbi:TniQ family protein [Mycobacterium sp. BMJ-28]